MELVEKKVVHLQLQLQQKNAQMKALKQEASTRSNFKADVSTVQRLTREVEDAQAKLQTQLSRPLQAESNKVLFIGGLDCPDGFLVMGNKQVGDAGQFLCSQ
jgi:hypothetical protein